jgi:hypothetical protein
VPATEVSDRAHGTDSDSGSLTGTACAAFSDKRCGLDMRRRTSGATRFTGKKEEGERVARLFELRLQVMGGCGCGCCGGENRIANRNGLEEVGVEE